MRLHNGINKETSTVIPGNTAPQGYSWTQCSSSSREGPQMYYVQGKQLHALTPCTHGHMQEDSDSGAFAAQCPLRWLGGWWCLGSKQIFSCSRTLITTARQAASHGCTLPFPLRGQWLPQSLHQTALISGCPSAHPQLSDIATSYTEQD